MAGFACFDPSNPGASYHTTTYHLMHRHPPPAATAHQTAYHAPITEGVREYTRSGHQSQKG
eukprot:2558444-Pyramimonas_sp.AAC.1